MQSTSIPSGKSIWLLLLVVLLSTGLIGARPLPAPSAPQSSSTIYLPLIYNSLANQTTYTQGFEGGVMPTGWTVIQSNVTQTWQVVSSNPHGGAYNIAVLEDENKQEVNEVLLSPVFTGSHGTVSMFSSGLWAECTIGANDCDLKIWLVKGSWDGNTTVDDVMVKLVDEDWIANYEDALTTVNLSSHLSLGESWRVAWQYTVKPGAEGTAVYMDDVQVIYAP